MISTRPARPAAYVPTILALVCLTGAMGVQPAFSQAPATEAPAWSADEYARLKQPETASQRSQRRAAEVAETVFAPADYRIGPALKKGLEEITPETEARDRKKDTDKDKDGTPAKADSRAGRVHVESEDFLDYDEERGIIYGRARTTVRYEDFTLVADRIILDTRLREAQAVSATTGGVELRSGDTTLHADSMRFNFERQQGVAYGVEGQHKDFYFRRDPDEKAESPSFQKINPQMSLFHKASVTACDFPIPHYRVQAREFILMERDRIFARNAVLYVWEVPVLFIPAYTRSISEAGPWSFYVGYDSELGAALRVTYDYYYKDYVPDPEQKKDYVRRSFNQTTALYDFYSERGHGLGIIDKYSLDYDRHEGVLKLYGINDDEREVSAQDAEVDSERSRVVWGHRSNLTDDLQFQVNIDWLSDPELYYDVLDFFEDEQERRRVPERRARAALNLVKESWLARVQVDIKDRVGRNRITDFSNPADDDADFDDDLDSEGRGNDPNAITTDDDIEGLPEDRWARVSERLPQVTIATPWLKPWRSPLYYQMDLNLMNNLDKGLNVLDEDDDSFVRGFDLYQSLMHALRVSDHSTWLNKFGFGFGNISRDDDLIGYDRTEGTVRLSDDTLRDYDEYVVGELLDTYEYVDAPIDVEGDEEIWRNGKDVNYRVKRKIYLDGYSSSFAYGDFESKWTTRFNDALTGYLRYFIRQGADDTLGETYRSLGNRQAQSDLYDFRLETHEITAGGQYDLLRPDLALALDAGHNLRSDYAPGEIIDWITLTSNYVSPREVFSHSIGATYERLQQRPPDHPDSWEEQRVTGFTRADYFPIPERLWLAFEAAVSESLNDDPAKDARDDLEDESDENDFHEDDTNWELVPIIGVRVGHKWKAELKTTYDGDQSEVDRVRLVMTRDLHDAELGVSIEARSLNDSEDDDEGDDDASSSMDKIRVKTALALKLPNRDQTIGRRKIETLLDQRKRQQAEED